MSCHYIINMTASVVNMQEVDGIINICIIYHQCKLQVMPSASASEVFVLINSRINTTSASCRARVKTILGTSRSRMQQTNAGSSRARSS